MKIRIYYEDTDAGGIVYHANYLKYCERARSELFFEQGLMPFEDNHSGFVVHRIEADYKGMARLGDLLEIRTALIEMRRSSLILEQKIFLDTKAIFLMKIRLVYLVEGKPSSIPANIKKLIGSLPPAYSSHNN